MKALPVCLRDTTEEDLPVFFDDQNDPEAARMAAFTPRDRAAFFAHWRTNILGSADARKKTVVLDGVVAGHVVSWTHEGRRLVGYWITRSHWGRGVASEAVREFVASHETTRPLYALVAAHNAASTRVLVKCGFRPTGERTTGDDGVTEVAMVLG